MRKGFFLILTGICALGLLSPGAGFAGGPAFAAPSAPPKQVLNWETGDGRSYLIPALEIPVFLFTLNRYDRVVYGSEVYGVTYRTFREHVRNGPWVFDQDSFKINQSFHPYQGTFYHGFARSAGLNYWEATLYTNAGSYLWETAGETGHPSINDQFASGIAGSFFGEPLFRMASLVLEDGGDEPGFWRGLCAAFISPPTGLNRLVFGDRFDTPFPSHHPATFTRLRLGSSLTSRVENHGISSTKKVKETTGDFSMAYGLPGKPGYTYKRPFDYFHFEFTAVDSQNTFENVMTRGLLYGTKYEAGDSYRGVWGLYGSYDYISPRIFRVSSTAASLGTTGQWWVSRSLALQGTAMAGPGFGAAGTIARVGERDYHYGATAQGLLALRLIFGNRAMLDATGRSYYVSGTGSTNARGSERISRGEVSFTVRIFGRHAIGVQYLESRRDAEYSNLPRRNQTAKTFSLAYNFLSDARFGAVEWRDGMDTDDR